MNEEKTFGEKFNRLQRLPALCAWNNSIFTDQDFDGISSLGEGSKQYTIEKTGRFGVGFNSVYHVTDCPMFISNNEDFVIFDPICDHFAETNQVEPGYRIDDIQTNMYGIYDDVLDGFNFGVNLDGDEKTSLINSTMFRFPIRSAYSKISNTKYDVESIKKMIDDYISNNQDTLLFLNNIKKISFFTVKSNSKNGLIVKCIHSEKIKNENKNDLAKRRQYFDNILKNIEEETSFSNIETNVNDYNIIIETSNEVTNSTKQNRYFMFEQFGFEYANKEEIDNMEYIKKQLNISKYFPMGGIAFNASLFETDRYKYQDFRIFFS